MSDPYAVPERRRDSVAPLVAAVRKEVDAWRSEGYPGASPTTRRLLEHWFLDEHEIEPGRPFRWYFCQREAIETLIYLHEVVRARNTAELVTRYATSPVPVMGQDFPRYVVKMATGSGKTKVMSLAIAWAYFHALRESDSPLSSTSLVIAPNLIVFERLREDFDHARVFRTDPVVPPEWRTDFDLQVCLRDDPVPTSAPGVLLLTNVQALYERRPPEPANPVDAVLGPRPPARINAPDPPLQQIARRGRVLVLNDEAHHLHDEIKAETGEPLVAVQTIRRLHQLAERGVAGQLDFSATPRDHQGRIFAETVVDYPLSQAIEDGIVKRPVIGELSGGPPQTTSDDAAIRFRRQLGAGVAKWRDYRDALAPAGRPLLFVMAEDTTAADQITRYLETIYDLAGRVLTIHVNLTGTAKGEVKTSELEQARRWAREVDRDDNPYAAIVSVLMLREGWDVRNVSVVVPLRAYTAKSQILPEQTLGRGLRRMTPPGSGVDETVVVIEHEAFRNLWDSVLEDPEYEGIERRKADEVEPQAQVITVEPERLGYDIAIPQLPRVLTRTAEGLSRLRVEDLPERRLELPEELRSDVVDYVGRDLLSRKEVERAQYPLAQMSDPVAVLAWFVNEVQRDTRLTGQFAVLAPLVKGYVETRVFGGPVDFADPLVLQVLAEPAVQETVLGVLREAVDSATLRSETVTAGEAKDLRLSSTKPFLWSRETAAATKSVFNLQPCDSGLEVQFCGFLDRCDDVAAFAKLAREVRFSLEYRAENGRLAYYYPDFVVRLANGEHLVLETKGRADLDVPHKDERATRWAVDASLATGVRWRYFRVDEELYDEHAGNLSSMQQLIALIYSVRRREYLASAPTPRRRTREEAVATMEEISRRMEGVTGVDEEIQRFRDSLGG